MFIYVFSYPLLHFEEIKFGLRNPDTSCGFPQPLQPNTEPYCNSHYALPPFQSTCSPTSRGNQFQLLKHLNPKQTNKQTCGSIIQ